MRVSIRPSLMLIMPPSAYWRLLSVLEFVDMRAMPWLYSGGVLHSQLTSCSPLNNSSGAPQSTRINIIAYTLPVTTSRH